MDQTSYNGSGISNGPIVGLKQREATYVSFGLFQTMTKPPTVPHITRLFVEVTAVNVWQDFNTSL